MQGAPLNIGTPTLFLKFSNCLILRDVIFRNAHFRPSDLKGFLFLKTNSYLTCSCKTLDIPIIYFVAYGQNVKAYPSSLCKILSSFKLMVLMFGKAAVVRAFVLCQAVHWQTLRILYADKFIEAKRINVMLLASKKIDKNNLSGRLEILTSI